MKRINSTKRVLDLTEMVKTREFSQALDLLLVSEKEFPTIIVSNCYLKTEDSQKINQLIGSRNLKNLTIANIGMINFGDFFKIVDNLHLLTSLRIMNAYMYDPSGLFQTLEKSSNLKRLDLSFNSFGNMELFELFINGLKNNKTLEYLNLSRNSLKDIHILFLCNSLNPNNTLRSLNLKLNVFKTKGLILLGELLENNDSLLELDISKIRLNESIIPFLELIKSNRTLRYLNLCDTISENEAKYLYEFLIENQGLKELNIYQNQFNKKLYHILNAFMYNYTLLNLEYLKPIDQINPFQSFLERNNSLHKIKRSFNEFSLKLQNLYFHFK